MYLLEYMIEHLEAPCALICIATFAIFPLEFCMFFGTIYLCYGILYASIRVAPIPNVAIITVDLIYLVISLNSLSEFTTYVINIIVGIILCLLYEIIMDEYRYTLLSFIVAISCTSLRFCIKYDVDFVSILSGICAGVTIFGNYVKFSDLDATPDSHLLLPEEPEFKIAVTTQDEKSITQISKEELIKKYQKELKEKLEKEREEEFKRRVVFQQIPKLKIWKSDFVEKWKNIVVKKVEDEFEAARKLFKKQMSPKPPAAVVKHVPPRWPVGYPTDWPLFYYIEPGSTSPKFIPSGFIYPDGPYRPVYIPPVPPQYYVEGEEEEEEEKAKTTKEKTTEEKKKEEEEAKKKEEEPKKEDPNPFDDLLQEYLQDRQHWPLSYSAQKIFVPQSETEVAPPPPTEPEEKKVEKKESLEMVFLKEPGPVTRRPKEPKGIFYVNKPVQENYRRVVTGRRSKSPRAREYTGILENPITIPRRKMESVSQGLLRQSSRNLFSESSESVQNIKRAVRFKESITTISSQNFEDSDDESQLVDMSEHSRQSFSLIHKAKPSFASSDDSPIVSTSLSIKTKSKATIESERSLTKVVMAPRPGYQASDLKVCARPAGESSSTRTMSTDDSSIVSYTSDESTTTDEEEEEVPIPKPDLRTRKVKTSSGVIINTYEVPTANVPDMPIPTWKPDPIPEPILKPSQIIFPAGQIIPFIVQGYAKKEYADEYFKQVEERKNIWIEQEEERKKREAEERKETREGNRRKRRAARRLRWEEAKRQRLRFQGMIRDVKKQIRQQKGEETDSEEEKTVPESDLEMPLTSTESESEAEHRKRQEEKIRLELARYEPDNYELRIERWKFLYNNDRAEIEYIDNPFYRIYKEIYHFCWLYGIEIINLVHIYVKIYKSWKDPVFKERVRKMEEKKRVDEECKKLAELYKKLQLADESMSDEDNPYERIRREISNLF